MIDLREPRQSDDNAGTVCRDGEETIELQTVERG